jgi:RNA polymerase sigma-70 factor, ECF subfamily
MGEKDVARQVSIDLIKGMARGEKAAFERFYDLHSSLSYNLALYILRSKSDAEEVVQDVFVQIWRQSDRYSEKKGSPEAWITMITRSRSIDKLRSARRIYRGVEAAKIDHEEPKPGQKITPSKEQFPKIAVNSALEQVRPEHRIVLELSYFRGMTHVEIAAELSIPVGTAKTRLRDGLKALRTVMNVDMRGKKN